MQTIIARLAARYISRRFLQSVLFIVGVAVGVAVVIAIDLANGSASRAFALSTESVTGRATHQIIGTAAGLPSDLYRMIRLEMGIRNSAPIISEPVRSEALGGQPLRLLGVDPFAEPPFRAYLQAIEVIGEGQEGAFDALTNFIMQPNTILITQTLATRWGVTAGDTLPLQTAIGVTQVRIIGILQPEDNASQQALDDLVMADIATAQELSGMQGRITRIDLILPDDYDTATLIDRLPAGAVLVSASSSSGALGQMTAAFEINLQALSLLAVVVGVFLIYNTVSFSVVQRRPVIGILRALGATRPQVFAVILGEAVILGAIGTVLGTGLGVIFGRFTVGLVSQTISDLYFTVNVTTVTVDPLTLLKGAGLGLLASVVSALIPSIDATRTAPVGSMRRSQTEARTLTLLPYLTGASAFFFFAGWAVLQIPTNSLIVSFGGLFCFVFAGALLTPAALVLGMRLLTPITERWFGVLGRLAPRAVVRSLSRTSIAVAALTIAVSVIVGVSVMISSFRNTVSDWLDTTIGADIFISSPLLSSNQSDADVDPAIRERVRAVEGVLSVSAARTVSAIAPDYPHLLPVNLTAVDYDISEGRGFVWNNAPNGDHKAALEAGYILVSEPFAFRRGITPQNNTLKLLTDKGEQTFEVIGVFYDYATDQGSVLMYRNIYDRFFDDRAISQLAAFVGEGRDVNDIVETLRSDTLKGSDLTIQSNRTLRAGVFDIFERTFTITIALRLLATLVAFIGILAALMSLQIEQSREYGVLRANGMTRGQLWRFTLLQTGLMGTVAGVVALPIGAVLAVVLIAVINVRSFGWTMQMANVPNEYATAFAVAVVAALLAGVYPAWRLARLLPAQALRSE